MGNTFHKKIFKIILLLILIGLLAGIVYLFYRSNQQIIQLQKEKEVLQQENTDLKKQVDEKNKQIEEISLVNEKKQSVPNTSENSASETDSNAASVPKQNSGSSIYDKIEGSDQFKALITAALNVLQAGDSEHFQMVASQVAHIYYVDEYGCRQRQRDIYIGSVGNDPGIVASFIVHEARHVYNVYVEGIYSFGTKEQELPCYEAELLAAQRLGTPANFIASVEAQVTYWQTQ